MFGALVQLDTV